MAGPTGPALLALLYTSLRINSETQSEPHPHFHLQLIMVC